MDEFPYKTREEVVKDRRTEVKRDVREGQEEGEGQVEIKGFLPEKFFKHELERLEKSCIFTNKTQVEDTYKQNLLTVDEFDEVATKFPEFVCEENGKTYKSRN